MTRFAPMFLFALIPMLGCAGVTEPEPEDTFIETASARAPSWSLAASYVQDDGTWWVSVLERNPTNPDRGCLLLADRTAAATWNDGVDETETRPRWLCRPYIKTGATSWKIGDPVFATSYRVIPTWGPDRWGEYHSTVSVTYGGRTRSMTLFNVSAAPAPVQERLEITSRVTGGNNIFEFTATLDGERLPVADDLADARSRWTHDLEESKGVCPGHENPPCNDSYDFRLDATEVASGTEISVTLEYEGETATTTVTK